MERTLQPLLHPDLTISDSNSVILAWPPTAVRSTLCKVAEQRRRALTHFHR